MRVTLLASGMVVAASVMAAQAVFADEDSDRGDLTFNLQSIAGLLQLHQSGLTPGDAFVLSVARVIPPTAPKSASKVTLNEQEVLEKIVLKGINISSTTSTPELPSLPSVMETGTFVAPNSDAPAHLLPGAPIQTTSATLAHTSFGSWQMTTPLVREAPTSVINGGATSYGAYAAGRPTGNPKNRPSVVTYEIVNVFGWITEINFPDLRQTAAIGGAVNEIDGHIEVDSTGHVTATFNVLSPFDVPIHLTGDGALHGNKYSLTLTGSTDAGAWTGTAIGNLFGPNAEETGGTLSANVGEDAPGFHIQSSFGGSR